MNHNTALINEMIKKFPNEYIQHSFIINYNTDSINELVTEPLKVY